VLLDPERDAGATIEIEDDKPEMGLAQCDDADKLREKGGKKVDAAVTGFFRTAFLRHGVYFCRSPAGNDRELTCYAASVSSDAAAGFAHTAVLITGRPVVARKLSRARFIT